MLAKKIFTYQFNIKKRIRKITEYFRSIKGKPSIEQLNKEIKLLIPYLQLAFIKFRILFNCKSDNYNIFTFLP